MEKLVERIEEREKLRIIFIGPLKAGKSSLINMLLSHHLKDFEMLLPVDNKAATNCIWKVESCAGRCASVSLGDVVQRQWPLDDLEGEVIRADIAEFLEDHFARDVNPLQNGEILVQLPLDLLDPFGCHYSLVDTPGFTESAAYEELVRKFLQDHSHIACMVCPLTEGTALPQQTQNMLKLNSYSKTFWVPWQRPWMIFVLISCFDFCFEGFWAVLECFGFFPLTQALVALVRYSRDLIGLWHRSQDRNNEECPKGGLLLPTAWGKLLRSMVTYFPRCLQDTV